MKKILLFILYATWLTALHAQSPTTQNRDALTLSSFVGYPLTIGDVATPQIQVSVNKLVPMNIELDSTVRHQIGVIPDQTVWHEGDITVGFYILTDTLKANNVELSYSIDFPPQGKIIFDETTGRFKYFPDKADVHNFTVTFTAQAEGKLIVQDVKFILMPAAPPEFSAFGLESVKPVPVPTDNYTIISETKRNNVPFNNSTRTVYSFSISGKELVFDNNNIRLRDLNGRKDIEELNIFAEKVIIRNALHFYQTNVTIYAKELIFEDLSGQTAASINTSPEMWDTRTDGTGKNGADAGNITLYIQDYKQSNPQKRFILVGGKGQDSNVNGTPGNGGNGGKVVSTIDVNTLCDEIHGSSGIKYNASNAIIGCGAHGSSGNFTLDERAFAWQHPNFISAVVKHAKDAYLNLHNGFTNIIFSEYTQRIADYKASDEWGNLDETLKMELESAKLEMQTIIYRIGQNLDYFGNPIAWVPMLSFEINKMAFDQEIEKAIRVMYLSYWLKNIDASNTERDIACKEAVKMIKDELGDNKAALNTLIMLIPELRAESSILQGQIENLIQRIEQKRTQLEAQAKSNVKKRNRQNKLAGILKTVVSVVAPVVDFFVPGAGTTLATVGAVLKATNYTNLHELKNL